MKAESLRMQILDVYIKLEKKWQIVRRTTLRMYTRASRGMERYEKNMLEILKKDEGTEIFDYQMENYGREWCIAEARLCENTDKWMELKYGCEFVLEAVKKIEAAFKNGFFADEVFKAMQIEMGKATYSNEELVAILDALYELWGKWRHVNMSKVEQECWQIRRLSGIPE